MERYRTVLTVEETPKDEAVLGEDMLARYGISKSIETTLAFLGPNDRISVATDCACLIMKASTKLFHTSVMKVSHKNVTFKMFKKEF